MRIWLVLSWAVFAQQTFAQLTLGPNGFETPPINLLVVFRLLWKGWRKLMEFVSPSNTKSLHIEILKPNCEDDSDCKIRKIEEMAKKPNITLHEKILQRLKTRKYGNGFSQLRNQTQTREGRFNPMLSPSPSLRSVLWIRFYYTAVFVLLGFVIFFSAPYYFTGMTLTESKEAAEAGINGATDDMDIMNDTMSDYEDDECIEEMINDSEEMINDNEEMINASEEMVEIESSYLRYVNSLNQMTVSATDNGFGQMNRIYVYHSVPYVRRWSVMNGIGQMNGMEQYNGKRPMNSISRVNAYGNKNEMGQMTDMIEHISNVNLMNNLKETDVMDRTDRKFHTKNRNQITGHGKLKGNHQTYGKGQTNGKGQMDNLQTTNGNGVSNEDVAGATNGMKEANGMEQVNGVDQMTNVTQLNGMTKMNGTKLRCKNAMNKTRTRNEYGQVNGDGPLSQMNDTERNNITQQVSSYKRVNASMPISSMMQMQNYSRQHLNNSTSSMSPAQGNVSTIGPENDAKMEMIVFNGQQLNVSVSTMKPVDTMKPMGSVNDQMTMNDTVNTTTIWVVKNMRDVNNTYHIIFNDTEMINGKSSFPSSNKSTDVEQITNLNTNEGKNNLKQMNANKSIKKKQNQTANKLTWNHIQEIKRQEKTQYTKGGPLNTSDVKQDNGSNGLFGSMRNNSVKLEPYALESNDTGQFSSMGNSSIELKTYAQQSSGTNEFSSIGNNSNALKANKQESNGDSHLSIGTTNREKNRLGLISNIEQLKGIVYLKNLENLNTENKNTELLDFDQIIRNGQTNSLSQIFVVRPISDGLDHIYKNEEISNMQEFKKMRGIDAPATEIGGLNDMKSLNDVKNSSSLVNNFKHIFRSRQINASDEEYVVRPMNTIRVSSPAFGYVYDMMNNTQEFNITKQRDGFAIKNTKNDIGLTNYSGLIYEQINIQGYVDGPKTKLNNLEHTKNSTINDTGQMFVVRPINSNNLLGNKDNLYENQLKNSVGYNYSKYVIINEQESNNSRKLNVTKISEENNSKVPMNTELNQQMNSSSHLNETKTVLRNFEQLFKNDQINGTRERYVFRPINNKELIYSSERGKNIPESNITESEKSSMSAINNMRLIKGKDHIRGQENSNEMSKNTSMNNLDQLINTGKINSTDKNFVVRPINSHSQFSSYNNHTYKNEIKHDSGHNKSIEFMKDV